MLRVDVEFGYHGYRKKWTSIFDISFQVCVRLRLGPWSDSKASSNRQDKWAWIRGAEPEWVWMAGHIRTSSSKWVWPSRFIKQSDRVGRFQPGLYWTLLKHIEPHDPVSDKICLFRKLDVGWRWNQQPLGFIQVYIIDHHRATRLWHFGRASPTFSHKGVIGLGSKDSLDPKLGHGLSRLCWSLGDAAEPPRYPGWIRSRQVAYGTYSV